MANEVVAHYLDGRMVKGMSLDVDPNRPTCHIRTTDSKPLEVKLVDLKALFFVRDVAGDPTHDEIRNLDPDDARARGAQPIEIQFSSSTSCRRT